MHNPTVGAFLYLIRRCPFEIFALNFLGFLAPLTTTLPCSAAYACAYDPALGSDLCLKLRCLSHRPVSVSTCVFHVYQEDLFLLI